jgi:hypothetical protein
MHFDTKAQELYIWNDMVNVVTSIMESSNPNRVAPFSSYDNQELEKFFHVRNGRI